MKRKAKKRWVLSYKRDAIHCLLPSHRISGFRQRKESVELHTSIHTCIQVVCPPIEVLSFCEVRGRGGRPNLDIGAIPTIVGAVVVVYTLKTSLNGF
ncbi:hypothetical protein PVK06_049018 [Gossypium arboreum]|uniref:Uncharacterized protein n=1 Tax=Gossypium arboreum TaxID=29729 RepID=A0ABR0MHG1_GOSAR|nr:hypothetical protein PVK06_049018 [Gossypium arboreum]